MGCAAALHAPSSRAARCGRTRARAKRAARARAHLELGGVPQDGAVPLRRAPRATSLWLRRNRPIDEHRVLVLKPRISLARLIVDGMRGRPPRAVLARCALRADAGSCETCGAGESASGTGGCTARRRGPAAPSAPSDLALVAPEPPDRRASSAGAEAADLPSPTHSRWDARPPSTRRPRALRAAGGRGLVRNVRRGRERIWNWGVYRKTARSRCAERPERPRSGCAGTAR